MFACFFFVGFFCCTFSDALCSLDTLLKDIVCIQYFRNYLMSVNRVEWIMCFPEIDTRVLTNYGYLFLEQIENIIRENKNRNNSNNSATKKVELLYACYDQKSKSIVYRPGKLQFPRT